MKSINLEDIKIIPLIETLRLEDISDEIYFSSKFSNYISNSRLSLINPSQGGTPEKFFEGKFDNFSDSLVFGGAVHQLVLQPESYYLCETVFRPTGKAGYIADYTYKKDGRTPNDEELLEAAKKYDYYKSSITDKKLLDLRSRCNNYWKNRALFEHNNKDKRIPIYLDEKGGIKLKSCLQALDNNFKIQELLHPVGLVQDPIIANEKTILLDVLIEIDNKEKFVLKLKSKLDNYSINFDTNTITVNDLKTTGKIVSLFNEAINNYRYYREMGMYSYLLSLCASKFYYIPESVIKSNFLVVSTIPEYYTKIVPMTRKLFMNGFNEFKNLVKLVAYYVNNDERYKYFATI